MKRLARHARLRPRIEILEGRALLSGVSAGIGSLPDPGPTNSVLVRFAPSASATQEQSALGALRASVVKTFADGPELIQLGEGIDAAGALRTLQADPAVEYAEANTTLHAAALPTYPNDLSFGLQWGQNNANNVDIDAPEAWGITTGSPATIVAVIDSGVDLTNPDLAGKIWTNPGNDAAQGYPNDIHGWNFVSGNNNVLDNDTQGHGTHVAGIIAAAANNSYGIAGVDWNAQIMPLKFLDASGSGSTDDAISAIYFAVNHGARVINASWGGVAYSRALGDAINYANTHNVVFVTAAGNESSNNDFVASYPASYRAANELSVASVDRNGSFPSFSNYGASSVDIAAPGVDITSTVPTYIDPTGIASLSGTSMSTAYVSGVAALLVGQSPQLTAAQVVQRIKATAKPLPSLAGKVSSGGIVDAYSALAAGATIGPASASAGLPNLVANASTDTDVRAAILASDEAFAVRGGTAQGFITGLYTSVLNRFPDPAGLQQWVALFSSGLASRFDIARAFLTSPEGRLAQVAHWYQDDLGRPGTIEALKADPGVAAWANLLVAGLGDNLVHAAILASPEYLVGHGGTPEKIVQSLYQDLYGRAADPAGVAAWAGLLYQGYDPFTVIRFFEGTAEGKASKVARWFNSDLGRSSSLADLEADPGVQAFASRLGNL